MAAVHGQDMLLIGGIGFTTTLLESVATSIAFGVVVSGFVTSSQGMRLGWTRKEVEGEALRSTFWGGVAGIYCLCLDLIVRFLG